MAKIVRKYQKQFADIGWTGNLGQFGSYAAGSPLYSNDPDTLQALAAFGTGMASALVNNAPPAIQDLDGLFHLITKQLQYIFQAGIPEWCATDTYYIGSLVHDAVPAHPTDANYANAGNIYMSLINDNTHVLDTNSEPYWRLIKSSRVRTDATNFVIASYDDYVLKCSYNGNVTVILPDAAAGNKGRIVIVKSLVPTASGSITVRTLNSQNIDAATTSTISTIYSKRSFISDGAAGWFVV